MPYPPEHKLESRQKILTSALQLFTQLGYESVTVDAVMANCQMTRGAFYAHFDSKAELYRQAIRHAFHNSRMVQSQTNMGPKKERLQQALSAYLSMEHLRGDKPCPLAFLASDIAIRDGETKAAFADAYQTVVRLVQDYVTSYLPITRQEILALSAMVVGTVALARTMDNASQAEEMLLATRRQLAGQLALDL
ncbi:TetR/AcrR family transcriptional regulator [Halioxenophilus sp. WMMB6]|uniref:TetR/AcrR family transcriptional regulator n=1 Tax=Halioxenophilus sp. WMMB6 TaxID=3073815 RepID=UPI00295EF3EB|nr:TetR/AcrR family transcriptional regulator [Halioxenophilus sp. WMMB6]